MINHLQSLNGSQWRHGGTCFRNSQRVCPKAQSGIHPSLAATEMFFVNLDWWHFRWPDQHGSEVWRLRSSANLFVNGFYGAEYAIADVQPISILFLPDVQAFRFTTEHGEPRHQTVGP